MIKFRYLNIIENIWFKIMDLKICYLDFQNLLTSSFLKDVNFNNVAPALADFSK